ncbi:MAG: hypothetical protein ABIQ60_06820 [Burkholderiaceae bacterium]
MSARGPAPPNRVPTLTEVVPWPESAPSTPGPEAPPETDIVQPASSLPTELTEEMLTRRILAELQRQVDLMLEYRLREILTPLLARATDTVVREARGELAASLRDLVARAVAQELARHPTR